MTRGTIVRILPAFLLLPAAAHYAGGWAVITVEELPDYIVAGEPVALTFTVRQHGMTPLEGLRPHVVAKAGKAETRVEATPVKAGQYTAMLNVPQPGEWTITIHSGFGPSKTTLLPLAAVASGTRALPPLPDAQRGRRLFVAKGCISCHLHGAVDAGSPGNVGPELTARRYPAEYLSSILANPSIIRSTRAGAPPMPNLNLEQREIASLVAFINSDRVVSGR